MTTAETAGRTVDEAVERALKELGAAREDVDVEILQEPKPALLGFGGREARVRVTRRPGPGSLAREAAVEILGLMGLTTTSAEVTETAEGVSVTLEGQDLDSLIGSHGRTLGAIEFLVSLRLSRRAGHKVPLLLDAAGYRARREEALRQTARQAAERAAREGKPVFLDPMDPRDRRTVHLALKDDPAVATMSEGEEDERRVVVHPREGSPAETSEGEEAPTDA